MDVLCTGWASIASKQHGNATGRQQQQQQQQQQRWQGQQEAPQQSPAEQPPSSAPPLTAWGCACCGHDFEPEFEQAGGALLAQHRPRLPSALRALLGERGVGAGSADRAV